MTLFVNAPYQGPLAILAVPVENDSIYWHRNISVRFSFRRRFPKADRAGRGALLQHLGPIRCAERSASRGRNRLRKAPGKRVSKEGATARGCHLNHLSIGGLCF